MTVPTFAEMLDSLERDHPGHYIGDECFRVVSPLDMLGVAAWCLGMLVWPVWVVTLMQRR